MARYVYPSSLNNQSLNPALLQLVFYKFLDNGTTTPLDFLALKMPDKISQPSTVNWDNENFGMSSTVIKDAINKATGNGEGAQTIEQMMTAVGARMAQQGAFNLIADATKLVGGSASANGLMGQVIGKTPNPYVTAIFRGIDFRNFSFTFVFTPLSEADCVLIDDIIRVLRANALPEYTDESAFLSYPSVCMITYFWKGQVHKYLNGFKRAACTSVSVDYTGTGSYQSMRNGFPTQIVVDTTWRELELVTRSDVTIGDLSGRKY